MARYKEKNKKSKAPVLIALLILALIAAGAVFYLFGGTRSTDLGGETTVEIPEGSSAKAITAILKENDLVMNEISFELYIRMNKASADLRPGEYTFGPGRVTYADILAELMKGNKDANTVTVTVPEGYTVVQVAELMDEKGLVSKDDFLYCAANMDTTYEYIPEGNDYKRLEGFLFPETYNIGNDWSSEQIINMMLAQFNENWTSDRQARADEMGMTVREIVTLASLVEREAKIDEERPVIADVIYNRLEADMLLQIDATVQYALGKQKDRLLYSDLEIDSPYNTYKYKGLPVGPIASPGTACIDAALYPADTPYFYYQTSIDGDGSHYFCETYEEHSAYSAQKE
ncbi:MAG: endolytic transglycosylase MltG [Bacillota bacterium]|nr:endolytic transglycosylase MltG [Bacillota bacterium]